MQNKAARTSHIMGVGGRPGSGGGGGGGGGGMENHPSVTHYVQHGTKPNFTITSQAAAYCG